MLNDKGVAPLIAFILFFGIVASYIAVMQANFVPEWNKEVEFKHSERMAEELIALNTMLKSCKSGKVVLEGGAEYPPRFILVNPPFPSTVVESYTLNVTINEKSYKSKGILFHPGYNYLPQTEFYLEHSALMKSENSYVVKESDVGWIKDRIEILLLNTSFSSFSSVNPVTLIINPVSCGGERFYRTLNLTFESYSNKTAVWWENELKDAGFNVSRTGRIIKVNETNVTISLTYVGLSTKPFTFDPPFPCKILNMTDKNLELNQGDTVKLTSRVVDEIENPVKGYPIEVTYSPSTIENPNRVVYTDENGMLWTYFNAVESSTNTVRFSGCGNFTEFYINVNPVSGEGCKFDLQWLDGSDYIWKANKNESRIFEVELLYNGNPVEDAMLTLGVSNRTVVKTVNSDGMTDQNGRAWINLTAKNSGNAKILAYYGGCSATLNLTVNISAKPFANFTYSPEYPAVGETVTFDASSSYDVDGSIVSYEWDFGDGSTGSGMTATHTYTSTGDYTVTLTVTDDSGLSSSIQKTVYVGGLIYNNDAVASDGPDNGGKKGGVEFTLTNRFKVPVTIDKITIYEPDNKINYLSDEVWPNNQPRYTEVYIEADTDSYADYYGGVNLPVTVDLGVSGDEHSNTNAVVNSMSKATFYLFEFYDEKGNNVNMKNKQVTIDVEYIVGSERKTKTFSFNVN